MADIFGTAGDDNLVGTGAGDVIYGDSGNDQLDGAEGDDTLNGNDGADQLLGGDGNDLLDGGEGNDVLRGGADANTLRGWGGNDSLFASGNDIVDGGAGNDVLTVLEVFGTIFDGGADSDSLILDFSAAGAGASVDLTYLFAGLNGSINFATVSSFESISGTIRGSAYGDTITIGQFYAGAVTMQLGDGNDSAVGGTGGDAIDGGGGNDTLIGGEGADVLTDYAGSNSLYGQGGDDVVIVGALAGGTLDGGGGTDRLAFDFGTAAAGATVTLDVVSGKLGGVVGGAGAADFETLAGAVHIGSGFNDVISIGAGYTGVTAIDGGGGNDQIGGGSGVDTLSGGDGNDVLDGRAGADVLAGGAGDDGYAVDNIGDTVTEAAGAGIDTVTTTLTSYTLGANLENLVMAAPASAGQSFGYGNALDNVLTLVASFSSVLYGMGGNDTINGSAAGDQLFGGDGNDTINAGGSSDVVYGELGNDTLNGGDGNDYLQDDAGTNTLNGGDGSDYVVFQGNAINSANGGAGSDSLDIRAQGRTSAFAINLTAMWSGGSGAVNGGTVTGFESVIGLEGTQWDDVINLGAGVVVDVGINDAGAGNDVLTGTDGANYILGGAGNDTISGGGGTDDLLGGDGDDAITFSAHASGGTVQGGSGIDTLHIAPDDETGVAALEIDFTALWSGGAGAINGAAVSGIEWLQADWITRSGFNDSEDHIVIGAGYIGSVRLSLGGGADTASGGSGDDIINGEQGDDLLRGGAGEDSLTGSYASDVIYGQAGDDAISGDTLDVEWMSGSDRLYGGDGNDTIEGGVFQDWLYGGAGNDVLRGDTIVFQEEHGDDFLNGGAGDDVLQGDDGNDVLQGGIGSDTMTGGAGDDLYWVDAAGDVVTESAGAGADVVRAAIDYALAANIEELFIGGAGRNGTGNGLGNVIHGAGASNVLRGVGGDDVIRGDAGRDTIDGGNGADLIDGGAGKDTLTGGADRDVFQFRDGDFGTTRALADVITDFSHAAAEKIQLNLVDANTVAGGNQAFVWIGSGAFTHVAGQLHYAQAGGNTYVEGDTNGDGLADFVIMLTGTVNLAAGDFVL
jgi:Ca2+-binding RTX toxin-like protein